MLDLKAITPFALDSKLTQDGLFIPFCEHVELMQFTGLLDRDGQEIFEGDILRLCYWEYDDEPELNSYAIHEVVWGGDGDYPAFDLKPPIEEMNGLQACFIGGEDYPIWCEVIGNVYESPHLLTKEVNDEN